MVDKGRLWIALTAGAFLLAVLALAVLTITRSGPVLTPAGEQAPRAPVAPTAPATKDTPSAPSDGDQVVQPAAGGGAAESARLDDSVDYIIRDRSGKIKTQESVGAK
jgi:hypothetical protein